MKQRRIRIIAKERQALDVGKFVLAVMGVGEDSLKQLVLPLGEGPAEASSGMAKVRSTQNQATKTGGRAPDGPWKDKSRADGHDQLALPVESPDEVDREVA